VWNKRTGNLVGGHQRLAVLDEKAGGQDYQVAVAVIDVDEKHEKQLNVKLNNTSMMGAWDQEALARLVLELPDSIEAMGFDLEEVEILCDSEAVTKMVAEKEEAAVEADRAQRGPRADKPARVRPEDESPHVVVVFESSGELDAFLRSKGLPLDDRYVDGKRFASCVGLD